MKKESIISALKEMLVDADYLDWMVSRMDYSVGDAVTSIVETDESILESIQRLPNIIREKQDEIKQLKREKEEWKTFVKDLIKNDE